MLNKEEWIKNYAYSLYEIRIKNNLSKNNSKKDYQEAEAMWNFMQDYLQSRNRITK